MGGEGPAKEVARRVADQVMGDDPERLRELKSGGNAAENEVAWSRNNLREAGMIDGSTRGVWKLTDLGWKTHLSLKEATELGRHATIMARKLVNSETEEGEAEASEASDDAVAEEGPPASPTLIEVMRALPPQGFERLCQRLLREAGIVEVEVTGKTGDGGIDGTGLLQLNEFVSFRVLFQCKKYQGSVGSGEIRNFRGAMSGRTDKGIFLTTGSFTADAQREAVRDGVPPIELVDADKLVSLMERLGLGVKPRTVYDVDETFFEPFRA